MNFLYSDAMTTNFHKVTKKFAMNIICKTGHCNSAIVCNMCQEPKRMKVPNQINFHRNLGKRNCKETKLQSWSNFNKKLINQNEMKQNETPTLAIFDKILRKRNQNETETKRNSKARAISTKTCEIETKTKRNITPKLEHLRQKAGKAK